MVICNFSSRPLQLAGQGLFLAFCLPLSLAMTAPVLAGETGTDATGIGETGATAAVAQPAPDSAQPRPEMAEIEAAWAAGDFHFVRQGLKRHAEELGGAFAQYRYGRVLLEGRGGPQDLKGAELWLGRAAAQNQAQAAVLLARLYLSALAGGPDRDPARAAVLFRQAAVRGNSEAQYYMGLLYGQGTGVTADPVEALTWLQAAAEQDHVEAQFELSRAYARGIGTPEDPARALQWMQSAASGGHGEAQFYLAYALDSGQGARRDPAAALTWLQRSAEGGFLRAQVALGKKYLRGDGVEPNPQEALRWLARGVQAGDPEAELVLGRALMGGQGLTANYPQAEALLQRGAAEAQPAASHALGQMREQGLGQPADLAAAVEFYRQAVDQGSGAAALRLGELAIDDQLEGLMAPHRMVPWVEALVSATAEAPVKTAAGQWLQRQAEAGLRPAQRAWGAQLLAQGEAEAAVPWLTRAAEAHDIRAQHQLGQLYIRGEGVAQDYVLAHKWLNLAAGGGLAEALEMRAVVADLMTPEQVAEAQEAARLYLEEARAGAASQ